MKRYLLLFFGVNLILSSLYLDTWVSHNNTSRILPVYSLYEHGTWSFDPYHEQTIDKALVHGHYYSEKAPLPSFVLVPFYGLSRLLGLSKDDSGHFTDRGAYLVGGFLGGTLPFCIFLTLIFAAIVKREGNLSPVLLTMLPVYGSFLYIFSGTFFSHLFAGILLLTGYILLRYRKMYFLAGLACGAAFLSEYALAVIYPVWFALLLWNHKDWKQAFWFGLGISPALLFLLSYNYIIGGDPFKMLYAYIAADAFAPLRSNLGFRLPDPSAIWGLLIGQYRGLLFYMPILGLAVWTAVQHKQVQVKRWFQQYWFSGFLVLLVLISSFFTPYGGWTYGPRYLLPGAMLLLYEGLRYLSAKQVSKAWFFAVVGFGLVTAWMAKSSVMYALPSEERNPVFGYVWNKLQQGIFNDSNMLTLAFGTDPKWVAVIWAVLFVGGVFLLQQQYQKAKHQLKQPA